MYIEERGEKFKKKKNERGKQTNEGDAEGRTKIKHK